MGNARSFLTGTLKAEDLDGPRTLTIKSVRPEAMQQTGDTKLVVYFEEISQRLILGTKANLEFLIDTFGEETQDWIGREIVLHIVDTQFGSKEVKGIRIRLP